MTRMGRFFFSVLAASHLIFFFSLPLFLEATISIASPGENKRGALEIIIGGGGDTPPPASAPEPSCEPPPPPPECPPPALPPVVHPPPPPPPPPVVHLPPPPPPSPPHRQQPPKNPPSPFPAIPFETSELRRLTKVIQRFKKTITSDPTGITKTWVGDKLCKDLKTYKGFICYRTKKGNRLTVGGINFNGRNFLSNNSCHLTLKDFVEEFKDLVVIHVNSNNFSDGIPSGISVSNLPTLFELDVSNNILGGPFPTQVLAATNLTYLDLRYNFFHSQLPPQVFTLDLDALFLNNNGFSGQLPENLGSTPVFFLTLANNYFTGQIPSSVGQAKYLLEVLFLNNLLSGCLPKEIGKLKNATVFDASINQLTGPIPHSFGCLKKLQILNLTSNHLYGPVPESLCMLRDLEILSLSSNYFTQVGEECRKLISRKILDINDNCILGLPNQRSPQECSNFFSKHMQHCSDEKNMLSYVPCQIDHSSSPNHAHRHQHGSKKRTSTTYAALNMHGP